MQQHFTRRRSNNNSFHHFHTVKAFGSIIETFRSGTKQNIMKIRKQGRLKIFTWHVHGSYLYYLSQGNYDIYIPVRGERDEGYYGRGETFPFGENVHEIPAGAVRYEAFDLILFQSAKNYLEDQFSILSPEQRMLPCIYLEHNTPHLHATDTRHVVDDPHMLLVHVTNYNKLMWDNNRTPAIVIEHGVTDTGIPYQGDVKKGLVVINHLPQRNRCLGWDIFRDVQQQIPLDLTGMGNGEHGIGEILHPQLPAFRSRYRFLFHPVRHTSLALAVCEAMMQGVPVVGLATTELVTIIRNGYNGFIHTDINYLASKMQMLLDDGDLARRIGEAGRETARERFCIRRFTSEWEHLFRTVAVKGEAKLTQDYSTLTEHI